MSDAVRFLTDDQYRRLFWSLVAGEPVGGPVWFGALLSQPAALGRMSCLVVVVLCGELGLRCNEARLLRWGHLGGAQKTGGWFRLPGEIAKRGKSRMVLCGVSAGLVFAERLVFGADARFSGVEDFVLGKWGGGGAWSCRGMEKLLRRWSLRLIGVPASPHTLRRTFGDRFRRLGDVRLAQLSLGHARLETTAAYLDGALDERAEVVRRWDEQLWPSSVRAATRSSVLVV